MSDRLDELKGNIKARVGTRPNAPGTEEPVSSQPAPPSSFARFARWTARSTGHPAAFLIAVLIVVGWVVTGPIFKFSDTWQLVINTGTTIITFLMVFLIQNTQSRDSAAVQLKLAELIRATTGAHDGLLDLEELTEEDADRLKAQYQTLARLARANPNLEPLNTGTPDVQAT